MSFDPFDFEREEDEEHIRDIMTHADFGRITFQDTELVDLGGYANQLTGLGKVLARTQEEKALIELRNLVDSPKFTNIGGGLSEAEQRSINIVMQEIPRVHMYNSELLIAAAVFITKKTLNKKTIKDYSNDVDVSDVDLLRYIRFVEPYMKGR